MKILLLAPRTDLLYVDDEVQSILRSGNQVTPVLGNISHQTFLTEVLNSDADALWLCTHGTAAGIVLSDGILPASLLTASVRNRFQLIVLNTCQSYAVAQMIQHETDASVIATISDIPDEEAFHIGSLFAHALARHGNAEAAYREAQPGDNKTYVWLAGRRSMGRTDGSTRLDRLERAQSDMQRSVQETQKSVADIQRILHRITSLMDGDPDYRIIGFSDQLSAYIRSNEDWKEATEKRIEENDDRLHAIETSRGREIVIAPETAALLVIIGTLCLVLSYIALTWLQGG